MIDSRIDTSQHIRAVQAYLVSAIVDLQGRLLTHDDSKLESPEKEAYDGLDVRLRKYPYGSDGYRAVLREMKPAIQHHYARHRHHPEHFSNGLRGMNLMDLVEMICDWKAASLRHPDDDVRDSMSHNQERFGFTDELKSILLNTLDVIDPRPPRPPELHDSDCPRNNPGYAPAIGSTCCRARAEQFNPLPPHR